MCKKIPTNKLLTNLREVAADLGKTPTQHEYDEHELSKFGVRTIQRRFDTWNKAVRAVDLEPNQKKNILTDKLLADLQNVAADLKKTPTKAEYREHKVSEFSTSIFQRRFDTWNKAIRAADLEPNSRQNIPTEELLSNLRDVAADLKKTPTKAEYREHKISEFATGTFEDGFNTWNKAIRAAGFEPNKKRNIPNDKLLINLQEVASELGKTPSKEEYRNHKISEFATGTFENRFGSWWKSVVAAGCRPPNHRPLQPATLDQYYRTAVNLPPKRSLPPLLFLFTGLSPPIAQHLTVEWLQEKRSRNIVRVPPEHTTSGEPWLFRIPDEWENPHTSHMEPTRLPKTLDWVLDHYYEIPLDGGNLFNQCLRVAKTAGTDNNRECKSYTDVGEAPVVRPLDLWITHGINLTRRGIDRSIINRRLGISHTGTKRTPEDFMLWLYVHEGYEHPEFEPPKVVLYPV